MLRNDIVKLTQKISNDEHHEPINTRSYADSLKNTSAIVIKPKDTKQSIAKTKSDIISNINPETSDDYGIAKVKTIKNGGIILKCHNPDELKKLAQEKELSDKYEIGDLKTPQPRLRIAGISNDIGEQHITAFLTRQNKHIFSDTSHCKLLKHSPIKNNNDFSQVVIEVDISTYKCALSYGHCLVGLDSCNIFDAIDIIRCFKCNGYNHSLKNCNRETSCPRCSSKHSVKDCKAADNELRCINCVNIREKESLSEVDINHACWDQSNCFAYKRAIEKLKSDVFGLL